MGALTVTARIRRSLGNLLSAEAPVIFRRCAKKSGVGSVQRVFLESRAGGKMNEVKVTTVGDTLMITGADKAEVELAAAELAAKGARILSQAEPMGSKWIITCKDPEDRQQ